MAGLDLASRSQSAPKPESQLVRNKAASSSATPHSRSGTLIGEADEQRARREGVAANHRHRGGRPLKLTPALVDVMVDLIEGGNPPRRAAVLLRVSEATYHRWMKKGAEQRRGKFREFRDRIQAAQAMGEAHLVSIVRESANTDPRLALQMLSRMNREDWAVNPPAKRTDEVPRTPALDRGTITHEHTCEHLYTARGIAADDADSPSSDEPQRALHYANPAALAFYLTEGRWVPALHLGLLALWLGRLARRDIKRLLVLMPPRHGKSSLGSEWFPTWYLGLWPDDRVIPTSYEADFAATWGRKVRDVLTEFWAETLQHLHRRGLIREEPLGHRRRARRSGTGCSRRRSRALSPTV